MIYHGSWCYYLRAESISANVKRFERLLAHNRGTRIVWAHAGRDVLGDWTVDLSRRLLDAHPNLSTGISLTPRLPPTMLNSPLDAQGTLRPELLALLTSFPDRFLIGTDSFYASSEMRGWRPPSSALVRKFVNQLPASIASKIAHENAERIYNLKR